MDEYNRLEALLVVLFDLKLIPKVAMIEALTLLINRLFGDWHSPTRLLGKPAVLAPQKSNRNFV